jgi:hypothetical protein
MSGQGWIKLYRQLQDNPLWFCEKFTRGQAWVDLLLLANHEESFFYKRGVKITVKRGQCARSEVELSDRWKWSRTKVRKFLKDLEKEQQIIQQKTNITQTLTIVNYDEYQKKEQQTGQQKNSKKTAEVQQKNTYKNVKNVNNVKKEAYGSFKNVFISEKDILKLKEKFNGTLEEKIENLSLYIESKGDKYKSHYATLLAWDRRDKPEQSQPEEWDK